MTPWAFIGLFCAASALCLGSAAAGGLFALWCVHVGRTGAHPLPKLPRIAIFGPKRVTDDDEDEPATNGQPAGRRVGP